MYYHGVPIVRVLTVNPLVILIITKKEKLVMWIKEENCLINEILKLQTRGRTMGSMKEGKGDEYSTTDNL